MTNDIEHLGVFIDGCSLEGESRADRVATANPNVIQLSRDRWLVAYYTWGFCGIDDGRSIIYQLREGSFDGRVITEGILAKRIVGWDLDLGREMPDIAVVRRYGHVVAFGVPKGARIGGKVAKNENVFAVRWFATPRLMNTKEGYILWSLRHQEWADYHRCVEWMQCRLNDAEDDIEILQPTTTMRQKGYEGSEAYCSVEERGINLSFVQDVPFNDECTEWVGLHHFNQRRIAAAKFAFNASTGLYEWVDTGPPVGAGVRPRLYEACIARHGDGWVVCARTGSGRQMDGTHPYAFIRTDDPFVELPEPVYSDVASTAPVTMYRCADGVLRVFSCDSDRSPYKRGRNPLYRWDLDPDREFAMTNCREVLDLVRSDIAMEEANTPVAHMCKVIPHAGGTEQFYAFQVRSSHLLKNDPGFGLRPLTPELEQASAIYYGKMRYAENAPAEWEFGD